jgi:hypothetical protein
MTDHGPYQPLVEQAEALIEGRPDDPASHLFAAALASLPDPGEGRGERTLIECLDYVTDALDEALRLDWHGPDPAELEAIRENAKQAVEAGKRLTDPWHVTPNTERVTLEMDHDEARALWHAAGTTVSLMEQVEAEPGNSIPPHAPLYGQKDRLVGVARRLDHEINCVPPDSPPTEGEADG